MDRRLRILILLFLLGMLASEGGALTGWGRALERGYYDAWHRLAGPRATSGKVVLVTVDDQSLREHADDPLAFWTPHFARAIATARAVGATLVGFDFLFTVSPEGWIRKMEAGGVETARNFDIPFREQIGSGRLILGAARVTAGENSAAGSDQILLPHRDYLLAVPDVDLPRHLGLTNVEVDEDGVVRHFVVRPAVRLPSGSGADDWPQLGFASLLAVRASDGDPRAARWQLGGRDIAADSRQWPIAFAGPPGSLPRLPLSRLLAANAAQDPDVQALKGKVVLLGVEFLGMGDSHLVPYSRAGFAERAMLMSGVELQGQIVDTLLGGRTLEPLPASARLMWYAGVMALALAVFRRASVAAGLAWLVALGLLAAVAGYVAFRADSVLPVAYLQLGLAFVFVGNIAVNWTAAERERQRVQGIFGRYVSSAVVDELLRSGTVPQLGGQAMQITVLFSDIRGFTTASERLRPDEVVSLLNGYFAQVCEIILDEGGTIDKFVGDAIMVEFGAPHPTPDHARRALRTALRMQEVAEQYRPEVADRFAGRGLPPFQIGIGVHTGEAVVGSIGSPMRSEFTAIGDTVNIASRIEGATKDMECVIRASRAAVEAAGAGVVTGRRRELLLKGKSETVEVLEVVAIGERAQ